MADSNITKSAIAAGFQRLCAEKPFDKISVADITGTCSLNRQTFYYHFEDKYDLLRWVYYNDAFLPLVDGITMEHWDENLEAMLDSMRRNKRFYTGTIQAHPELFCDDLKDLLGTIFEDALGQPLPDRQPRCESGRSRARFLAHGLCGMILDWVRDGMACAPKALAGRLRGLV